MTILLLILVMSVFLGTEILSISTPIGQLTIYRLLVVSLIGMSLIQIKQQHKRFTLYQDDTLSLNTYLLVFWWLSGFASLLWSASLMHWIRGMFLLTIGLGAWLGLGYWLDHPKRWWTVVNGAWIMMSLLVIWGLIEIRFNIYLFADMNQLDPYRIFKSNAMARKPITVFTNQNDYATMLLGYLTLTLIQLVKSQRWWMKIIYSGAYLTGCYLIYRTRSRMLLGAMVLFTFIYLFQVVDWSFVTKYKQRIVRLFAISLPMIFVAFPRLIQKIMGLYYQGGNRRLSGDVVRLNLYRNGLLFLGQTYGFGVGSGNLSYWIKNHSFLPTETVVNNSARWIDNMHNWWLEILVGYGVLVFIAYLVIYGLYFIKLIQLKKRQPKLRWIHNAWIAFLITFIPASITSANNMLIEWHWVIFGLLLSWVSMNERQLKEGKYEY